MKVFLLIAVLINTVLLIGCSTTPTAEINTSKAPRIETVQTGRVLSVKNVTMEEPPSSTRQQIGSVTGRVAGGAMGSGYGSVAGSIIGSMVGGMIGARSDHKARTLPALKISVRLDDGQYTTVTQLRAKTTFKAGDNIKLTMKQGKVIVVLRR
ncbi:MAG: hypothetical protein KAH22_02735 [Thiotrichaceae bacterium]|nr:hypothetical protein [Thiotrichaceae bacterium]